MRYFLRFTPKVIAMENQIVMAFLLVYFRQPPYRIGERANTRNGSLLWQEFEPRFWQLLRAQRSIAELSCYPIIPPTHCNKLSL